MNKKYDLIVIGAGPAGNTAALESAALGKSVLCIEKSAYGGTCLNKGCIPTKAIIESALAFKRIKACETFGISVENVKLDYAAVKKRADDAILKLSKGLEFLYKKAKIETLSAAAKISSANIVAATLENGETKEFEADKIFIATGAKHKKNPDFAGHTKRLITSDEALKLENLPQKIAVLGAGAIGVEFAWIWNAFGVDVSLIEFQKNILPNVDEEISKSLERSLKKQGIKIFTKKHCSKILEETNSSITLEISDENGATEIMEADLALWACGMEGNSENLFSPELNLEIRKNGTIKVDENFKTNIGNIYAAGDIIGAPMLAHAAGTEAKRAIEMMYKVEDSVPVGAIPACVYCSPQVACVGVSEKEGVSFALKASYLSNGKAVASSDTEGFIKIVFENQSERIIGAHIFGAEAAELISNFVIAIDKKMTRKELAYMTFPHPALAEMIPSIAAI